jgi:predicted small secreted protein
MRTTLILTTFLMTAMLTAACEREGPAESTGKKIDEMAEDVADAAEELCEDVKDAANADDPDCDD